ncbi:indole-3-glycerol phosphate synthase TrpC [Oscillatoria amoena NRMC-F 0135]|nr:indole-3-glycerol phosphate synthase TrpC [Oscillatoria amoena NRMC-F 0135]
MKNILSEIVKYKRAEVARQKQLVPQNELMQSVDFTRTGISLKEKLRDQNSFGLIAEFKRRSPSQGLMHAKAAVASVTAGYCRVGAVAISVLTDAHFFGGSLDDLVTARRVVPSPILRKDFVVDEYQIIESKSAGADAILLIASVLESLQIREFTDLAHELGLEVVLEVHDEHELRENTEVPVDVIGVNNRNLTTFNVSVETSIRLAGIIPEGMTRISESGLESPVEIIGLKRLGYHGFLIGQRFMHHADPVQACDAFLRNIEQLTVNSAS